jgi:hypothetical protein
VVRFMIKGKKWRKHCRGIQIIIFNFGQKGQKKKS